MRRAKNSKAGKFQMQRIPLTYQLVPLFAGDRNAIPLKTGLISERVPQRARARV